MSARLLVAALADPARLEGLSGADWTALIRAARAEALIGQLAHRSAGIQVPPRARLILDDALAMADANRRQMLWEAEMARRALVPLGTRVVLLKGAAYAAANLGAAAGRSIGDLDLLVPRTDLDDAERAVRAAGWEPVKSDPYDDAYYRRWMHELPPLIHAERDRMLDLHHTILPPTGRRRPDADALVADAVALPSGLFVLSPADRIVHAAAHCLYDADLSGGLRSLWDIRCLLADADAPSRQALLARARHHRLDDVIARALRLCAALWEGAPAPLSDRPFLRRLLARDGLGRQTRPWTRLAFSMRGHWLRMPPAMLARHLAVKATKVWGPARRNDG